jgi:hypothetical protein
MRRTLLGVFALVAPTWIDAASAQSAAPALAPVGPPYAVAGELAGGRPGQEARDISGVACLPSAGSAPKRCLVVNDENRTAQFVTLDAGTVVPGEEVTLIGTEPSETTLGRAPTFETCPKNEVEFSDLDGEGVAYAAPYFYVVGSHGCSRKGAFRLSSFILARFRVDADGAPVGPDGEALPAGVQPPVETTYRLSDLFRSAPALRPFFGKGLDERSNGLNLEGITVIGDRLFAGLRAPSVSGTAFLVEGSVADLFAPGRDPAQAAPVVIPLALGEASGIRDLAPMPDGRLLVLAGPAQGQPVPSSLFVAEPRVGGALERIGTLGTASKEDGRGEPEAVVPLGPDRVLVWFDSVPSGRPRAYRIN